MSEASPRWIAVVAVADNGVIGRDDQLPWKLRSDLRRFKSMTMGHCLLMGRKTFQSIGKPLPGRQTIVLSRTGFACPFPQVKIAATLAEVAALVVPPADIMVVGGAEIYSLALPLCNELWITRVRAEVQGNVFFPTVDWSQWNRVHYESIQAGEADQWPTEFEKWTRK
jgi:dihydrofolate reductase